MQGLHTTLGMLKRNRCRQFMHVSFLSTGLTNSSASHDSHGHQTMTPRPLRRTQSAYSMTGSKQLILAASLYGTGICIVWKDEQNDPGLRGPVMHFLWVWTGTAHGWSWAKRPVWLLGQNSMSVLFRMKYGSNKTLCITSTQGTLWALLTWTKPVMNFSVLKKGARTLVAGG